MISGEIERKPFFCAVDVAFTHRRYPVVMGAAGIIAPVIVNDCRGIFVRQHFFAVNDKPAFRLKEVFLAVQRAVFAKRNACYARF